MMKKSLLLVWLMLASVYANAQQATTSSSAIKASAWGLFVPFDLGATGTEYRVTWGMDTAWDWDANVMRGTNHIGKDNLGYGRVSFEPNDLVSSTWELTARQKADLDSRLNHIALSGVTDVLLNCDHEWLIESHYKDDNGNWKDGGQADYNASVANYKTSSTRTNNTAFYNLIKASVMYIRSKGFTVAAIAPFNEPDYSGWNEGTTADFKAIAQLIKQDSYFDGIRICGGNTLNCDYADTWYQGIKPYIDEGNTHQLAGSFDNYANFFATVKSDGNVATADELHNIGEAIVGAQYGMENGIWWGFDGIARGELCRVSNNGKRLGYRENRSAWTVAAVYRYNTAGGARAFLGTSERQANPSTYVYRSQGMLAYFDGEGPFYDYSMSNPGGASGSYQNGQTNAERVINIHYGEDVPVEPIVGQYKIVNKATGKLLSVDGGTLGDARNIYQWADGGLSNQTWTVAAVAADNGGDYSHVFIYNANTGSNTYHLDDLNWGTTNGSNVIIYPGGGSGCEQWALLYEGNGYYRIVNRFSGLCLDVDNGNTANGTNIFQWERNSGDNQLWKFVPADYAVDQTAPSTPQGLTAEGQSGSVKLSWTANSDADIYRYMIYRYNTAASTWECIGRKVSGTSFIDNTCPKGQTLRYRIRALDKSYNLSQPSAEASASTTSEPAMVARWNGNNLNDATKNKLHAVQSPAGISLTTNGTHQSFQFNGSTGYLELPYYVGDFEEMTFATWARGSSTTAWQRIFDFGNGEDSYLFLTPTNGSRMRFEIKANGTTQGLNATTTLGTNTWKHIAVTIGPSAVKIYIDGTLNATATDITLRPSDVAPTLCYLGRSMFDADPAFNGMLSDVRLYNYELTAAEVAALANITDNSQTGYDITIERLPAIADNVNNWDVHTNWANQTSTESGATNMSVPYVRAGNTSATLSKTLKYLPEGTYTMTANAYAYYSSILGSRNNQELFLNSGTLQINSARNRTGTLRTLTGAVGTDHTLDFGYRTTSNSYATNLAIDNVKIVFQGTAEEFAEGLEDITYDIIGDAQSLLSLPMNKDVKAALQAAITNITTKLDDYTTAVIGETATKTIADNWINALESLSGTVVTNAQHSATAYADLKDAMDAAEAKATAHPQTVDLTALSTFNSSLGDVNTNYTEGNYTDDQIPAAIIETKRIANRYVMADAVVNARETAAINVTSLVVENDNFVGDSYIGWTTSPNPGMGYDSAEFFNTTFNIFQVLYGMPAGTYRFETRGFYRYGGQPENYTAYNNGTLQRNAKLYIIDADGTTTVTGDVMAISDDPTPYHEWGNWSSQTYNGYQVPDNMQAASEAIDVRGRYVPANGYNSVTLSYSEGGDITVGARKDVAVGADWTFFGDFSLYYLGNFVTLNETAATLPATVRSSTVNIDLTRTIKAGEWSTLCLPFSMTEAQVDEVFGSSAQVKELTSIDGTGNALTLHFTEVQAIAANVPYIVSGATPGSNYLIFDVYYNPSTENNGVTIGSLTFQGNYTPYVLNNSGGQDYYLYQNQFRSSKGGTTIKGFRGWFKVNDSNVKTLGWNPDGDDDPVTTVQLLQTADGSLIQWPADIYSISGQLLRRQATTTEGLPRGIYLVGGQRVLVR